MKKVMFILIAAAFVTTSVSSCKKCGYCQYPTGGTSNSVCKDNSLGGLTDNYAESKSQCEGPDKGKWVVTK